MGKHQTKIHLPAQPKLQRMTLAQYVLRRNGVPIGDSASLRNMVVRSFGAGSFGRFWQYWSPIFGYGLGKYVYSPLRRFMTPAPALIVTFVVSGGIHDLVTMAVRRSSALLFTPWFFFLGVGVIAGRGLGLDFSTQPWLVRASINLAYILVCLAVTLVVRQRFTIL
jgi:hypothetical protein